MLRRLCALASLILLAVLASCSTPPKNLTPPPEVATTPKKEYSRPLPPGKVALERITDPAQIPDFSAGYEDKEGLLASIAQSLTFYAKPSSAHYFPYLEISRDQAVNSLRAFRDLLNSVSSGGELNRIVRERFDVYRSVGWDGSGAVLFTGYCEPIYQGAKVRTEEFRFPLYRLPEDLVKATDGTPQGRLTDNGVVPYFTRAEIDRGGALAGKNLELVWLRSPLESYICHVQGSARIQLPDGKEMKVGYAGKNGRPYASLGQALVDEGKVPADEMSLAAIKDYFAAHPDEIENYLVRNDSYVFFQENWGGPYGSIGCEVTPWHTIATDKSVFPRGALAFVVTVAPRVEVDGRITKQPYRGFALDQDTGGAIRSAGRCDLFIGTGPQAELLAGYQKAEGKLYYLFLKAGAPRS
ncbi:MAG: MltA domain-containing protein [Planctomycetes bacterium]|nr:MltA domain-containing protein [Planctomycetota bacterium]